MLAFAALLALTTRAAFLAFARIGCGIFQRRLKDKEKLVNAWTEMRAGMAEAPK